MFFSLCEQDLKEEIDIRLSRVQDIKYEPQLLADGDARLLQLETQGSPSTWRALEGCFSEESSQVQNSFALQAVSIAPGKTFTCGSSVAGYLSDSGKAVD